MFIDCTWSSAALQSANWFTHPLLFVRALFFTSRVLLCLLLLFLLLLLSHIKPQQISQSLLAVVWLQKKPRWKRAGQTLSSSDCSFSASSSVSSWILGPSSFFFFFSSASLALLSAFSFFSFSCFICFSLWAFSASLLWCSKESLTSWKWRRSQHWTGEHIRRVKSDQMVPETREWRWDKLPNPQFGLVNIF